jgi:predicted ester cyclase
VSLEENKAIVRRLFEEFNKHDVALLDKLMAPDYFDHAVQSRSLEEYKQFISMWINGFPDFHVTIEDIIAEGDKVWVRNTFTGTHTGEFHGLAPTRKKCKIMVVHIYRIFNGKVVECWSVDDFLDCYKQLGVIEYIGFPEDVT